MCFNKFSPVSLQRYWALQLLASALPSIVFIVYGTHILKKTQNATLMREKLRKRQKRDIDKFKHKIQKKNKDLFLDEMDLVLVETMNDKKLLQDEELRCKFEEILFINYSHD